MIYILRKASIYHVRLRIIQRDFEMLNSVFLFALSVQHILECSNELFNLSQSRSIYIRSSYHTGKHTPYLHYETVIAEDPLLSYPSVATI